MSDVDKLLEILTAAFHHQVTQFTAAFTLAALLHARTVKKEIGVQFAAMIDSINNVARTLGEDLKEQKKITGVLVEDVSELKTRVQKLEIPKKE